MGRQYCGKRRNCSFRAISPFPSVFSKRLVLQTCKNKGLFWKGLTQYFLFMTHRHARLLSLLHKFRDSISDDKKGAVAEEGCHSLKQLFAGSTDMKMDKVNRKYEFISISFMWKIMIRTRGPFSTTILESIPSFVLQIFLH